jgi:hypothetical protein
VMTSLQMTFSLETQSITLIKDCQATCFSCLLTLLRKFNSIEVAKGLLLLETHYTQVN